MANSEDLIRTIARRAGALDPGVSAERRAERLRAALLKEKHQREVVVHGDYLEVSLDKDRDTWVRLRPDKEAHEQAPPKLAEIRHDLEDGTIQAMADLLEAKYRADKFREHYLGGTLDDPSLFHDGIELAMRTWKETMTLSIRAQRSMIRLMRDALPEASPRPRTRLVPALIELRWLGETLVGRFAVRNERASHLKISLKLESAPGVTLEPKQLLLRPGEQQYVTIEATGFEPKETVELMWADSASPLMPLRLEVPERPSAS